MHDFGAAESLLLFRLKSITPLSMHTIKHVKICEQRPIILQNIQTNIHVFMFALCGTTTSFWKITVPV